MFFGDGKSHAILIRGFRKARDLDSLLNGMDERFFHSPCVDHGTSKPRGSSTSASFEYPPEKFTTWPLNTHHFEDFSQLLPAGKHTKNYGTSPFLMGKSTISMAIFNSKLFNYQRVYRISHSQSIKSHVEVPFNSNKSPFFSQLLVWTNPCSFSDFRSLRRWSSVDHGDIINSVWSPATILYTVYIYIYISIIFHTRWYPPNVKCWLVLIGEIWSFQRTTKRNKNQWTSEARRTWASRGNNMANPIAEEVFLNAYW
jgi:hypothetical protein